MGMLQEHTIEIRVRYSETDAMGFLHHANFFKYFEMGRIELLRAQGGSYKEMEAAGIFLVVARIGCQYHSPAFYDDVLTLRTIVTQVSMCKIEHEYQLLRGDVKIATGTSTLACLDREGRIQRLPEEVTGKAAS